MYPDALAPGTEVGTWRVVERVGMGGYGTVYRVEDMARPGDFYAYKLAQYADDKRMVREMALMMAKGDHPNVVRFHGCARWPHPKDGYPGFVMDWVPGPPIHLWAETEGSTFRQLAEAGGKVALAMGTLHERGVLHRDLKPEHIIIRESDGEPVLLDFGAGWYEGAEPLTSGTLPPGTLPMRSPESLRFLWTTTRTARPATPSSAPMTSTRWACVCTGPPPGTTPSPRGWRTWRNTPSCMSSHPRPGTSTAGCPGR